MASVLLTSLPVPGHLGPVLAVAVGLAERGHRVRVLTGGGFREQVERAGVRFVELPDDAFVLPDQLERPIPGGPRGVGVALEQVFVRRTAPQFAAVRRALAAEPADVVVTELLFMGTYPLLASAHRPRVVLLGISPLPVRGGGTAPYGLGLAPARGPLARARNAALSAVVDRLLFARPERTLAREFQRLTGTPPEVSLFDLPLRTDAVVQLCPPGLEYPRPGLRVPIHFAGPLPVPPPGLPEPPWWADLDAGRPVVHVTQGTVANTDLHRLVVPTLRALADRPVLVVVSTGGRPVEDVGPVPANARVSTFLDYGRFLPRVDVLVTNGGYGTVNLALAHGIPLVVSGRTEDKAEVGARVAWSGAGIDLRTDRPRPQRLSDAVGRVLTEPGFARAAGRLRAEIGTAGGLDTVDRLVRGT
ncbi:glycosyltransferase [Kineococcus sp. SYSU DK002]|uniref:glycosyltransferase n=1 Tax=Kineococcus sp. SYSU DK002 TaxID=3383123 RepID=UPI003D7DD92C